MAGGIRVEREGAVAWIVFDHEERRNAITGAMWRAIPGIARELGGDSEVRVVVMRGAGDTAFVSGADISEFQRERNADNSEQYDLTNTTAFDALQAIDKPVLAMLHGYCVGGGAALALCADIRFAADDLQFGIPAARLGLGYGEPSVGNLLRVVGPAVTCEMLFTARRLGAAEALRFGLVNAVYPKAELEGAVRATAATIAANAPLTVSAAKQAVRNLGRAESERDSAAVNAAVRTCLQSEDYREGVRAFLEKRPPVFRGR